MLQSIFFNSFFKFGTPITARFFLNWMKFKVFHFLNSKAKNAQKIKCNMNSCKSNSNTCELNWFCWSQRVLNSVSVCKIIRKIIARTDGQTSFRVSLLDTSWCIRRSVCRCQSLSVRVRSPSPESMFQNWNLRHENSSVSKTKVWENAKDYSKRIMNRVWIQHTLKDIIITVWWRIGCCTLYIFRWLPKTLRPTSWGSWTGPFACIGQYTASLNFFSNIPSINIDNNNRNIFKRLMSYIWSHHISIKY